MSHWPRVASLVAPGNGPQSDIRYDHLSSADANQLEPRPVIGM
jgi:hypothetical protein